MKKTLKDFSLLIFLNLGLSILVSSCSNSGQYTGQSQQFEFKNVCDAGRVATVDFKEFSVKYICDQFKGGFQDTVYLTNKTGNPAKVTIYDNSGESTYFVRRYVPFLFFTSPGWQFHSVRGGNVVGKIEFLPAKPYVEEVSVDLSKLSCDDFYNTKIMRLSVEFAANCGLTQSQVPEGVVPPKQATRLRTWTHETVLIKEDGTHFLLDSLHNHHIRKISGMYKIKLLHEEF
jgi:hypothetical protein